MLVGERNWKETEFSKFSSYVTTFINSKGLTPDLKMLKNKTTR